MFRFLVDLGLMTMACGLELSEGSGHFSVLYSTSKNQEVEGSSPVYLCNGYDNPPIVYWFLLVSSEFRHLFLQPERCFGWATLSCSNVTDVLE